jgi:hypothetical protein
MEMKKYDLVRSPSSSVKIVLRFDMERLVEGEAVSIDTSGIVRNL